MYEWTKEQQQAILEEGKNIIVSAGAGSGKTMVLTERVLRKLKSGININQLLILTFTNKAAEEMKTRIKKRLSNYPLLKEQLDNIDSSYITTFDSYVLSIVKKYHYLLNIPKEFTLVEEFILITEKKRIMTEIFNNYYQSRNKEFLSLINSFCVKDDTDLIKELLSINNKLDTLLNKQNFFNEYNKFYDDKKLNQDIKLYLNIINSKKEEIRDLLNNLKLIVDNDNYNDYIEVFDKLINSSTYEEYKTNIDFTIPRKKSSSDEEINIKKELTKKRQELKKLLQYTNVQEIKDEILSTKNNTLTIVKLLDEFNRKLDLFKVENNMYYFNDIALMAIKIIEENTFVREEIKNSFNEILIDEYQDTNDIQEKLISLIANNNVYMVGDIKQSIYRFRNANPYIFKNKYDDYSNNEKGLKIDLNTNFRSRRQVLAAINNIFNKVMDVDFGGADYKKNHNLLWGNKNYNDIINQNNDIETYKYEKNDNYSNEEIEAFFVAQDIRNKIENGYLVFDKNTNQTRVAQYSDFTIIVDRGSSFSLFKKIFEYFNIPLTLIKDEELTDSCDLYLIKNIIGLALKIKSHKKKIIEYDQECKYYFVSIARSYLFNLRDNEIFEYFINNNFQDSIIHSLIKDISDGIDNLSLDKFLEKIYTALNIYEKLITTNHITESMIRLEKLFDICKSLSKLGYTIDKFKEYLDDIIDDKIEMKYHINDDHKNTVKLTNIHKSKGLEYTICYYSLLYKKFNDSDMRSKILFNSNFGICIPSTEKGLEYTIYKNLIKEEYSKEEISEKIRLFYVALTRAKEKIILVLPNIDCSYKEKNKYNSFQDIYESVNNNYKDINIDNLKLTKNYIITKVLNIKEEIPSFSSKIKVEEIKIDNNIIGEETFSKKSISLIDEKTYRDMENGTKIHEMLEVLDFKNIDYDIIKDDYIKEKIHDMLDNDIFKNIDKAKIYHEYEFIYEKDNVNHHGIIDLMLEYDEYIDIIDYKLSNIEDMNYKEQLDGYLEYIRTKTSKPINIYLYSILLKKLKKLN